MSWFYANADRLADMEDAIYRIYVPSLCTLCDPGATMFYHFSLLADGDLIYSVGAGICYPTIFLDSWLRFTKLGSPFITACFPSRPFPSAARSAGNCIDWDITHTLTIYTKELLLEEYTSLEHQNMVHQAAGNQRHYYGVVVHRLDAPTAFNLFQLLKILLLV
ncbi:hypothetical protein ACJX0J_005651, partial [Zea mays]